MMVRQPFEIHVTTNLCFYSQCLSEHLNSCHFIQNNFKLSEKCVFSLHENIINMRSIFSIFTLAQCE